MFASKDTASLLHRDNYLLQLIARSNQLQVLSLRYCQHVSEETLEIVSQHANPFYLRELHLDGCERVNDAAIHKLVKPKSTFNSNHVYANMVHSLPPFAKELHALAGNEEDLRRMVNEVSICGSRGLELISLAECRHVTDEGVIRLGKCKFLRSLCLLGCANLKDEGICKLASDLVYLQELDIGSTNITGETLRKLVTVCLDLKKVNITGCKRLNASDDIVLK